METSSLNFLLRKQSSQAFSVTTRGSCSALVLLQNILRTNWSWFLGLALLPFHRSSVGSAAAEERLQWLFGHSRESWTLSLSQLPAKAAAVPRALGWRCTGHSQPWAPVPSASTERQNPKLGFHLCPHNHISPTAIGKNPFLNSPTCSCPPWSSANTKTSLAPQQTRENWAKVVQGKSLRAHQGCPKQLLLKDHYSTKNRLVMWLEM